MSNNNAAFPNVWKQMGYDPPRGRCNFNKSYITSGCPCLRFMLHPLKSASGFECDGCGHHASFHEVANLPEERIRLLLKDLDYNKKEEERERRKKRQRTLDYDDGDNSKISSAGRLLEEDDPTGNDARENRMPGGLTSVFNAITARNSGRTTRTTRSSASRASMRRARGTNKEASDSEYQDVISVD
ncbi:uncharacterized protein EI97DRAFT_466872 [Westerdykella ornata]|uniref:Uncharacterized protein n=1 Tax=Westerdykella ornata TaxID=318751 RepID=A0A6A6JJU1_WESOR|nr:uncharacterized protein EI97DRAFT_466872 [Westerdykella ornata]KAF2276732.1 hypothetical protein EI97DRAFT_466872 [Westerdykella ornata]